MGQDYVLSLYIYGLLLSLDILAVWGFIGRCWGLFTSLNQTKRGGDIKSIPNDETEEEERKDQTRTEKSQIF